MYLKVESVAGMIVNDCYGNVKKIMTQRGGSIQHGWQIWEFFPRVLLEAEFHAVWLDDQGNYHDITPKEISNIDRILFLPDNTKKYEGRQINNVRIPLVDDPLLDRFIKDEDAYFEATNRGGLADYHGALLLTDEMKRIQSRVGMTGLEIIEKYYSSNQ